MACEYCIFGCDNEPIMDNPELGLSITIQPDPDIYLYKTNAVIKIKNKNAVKS